MTQIQQRVLIYIQTKEDNTIERTYSWYVRAISSELGVPESTAKWSLNNLRAALLIESGTLQERGIPLRLTYPGLIIAEKISKNNIIKKINKKRGKNA
jgi:hypothetical protein